MANPINQIPQAQRDVAKVLNSTVRRAAAAGALAQQRAIVDALDASLASVTDEANRVSPFISCPHPRPDRRGNLYRCGKLLTRTAEITQRRCDDCRRYDDRNAATLVEARQQKKAAEARARDAKRRKNQEEKAAELRAQAEVLNAAAEQALTEAAQISRMFPAAAAVRSAPAALCPPAAPLRPAADRPRAPLVPVLSFASPTSLPKPLTYVPPTMASPLALAAPANPKALTLAEMTVSSVSTVPAPAPGADGQTGDDHVPIGDDHVPIGDDHVPIGDDAGDDALDDGVDDMDVEYPYEYESDSDEHLTDKVGIIDITDE